MKKLSNLLALLLIVFLISACGENNNPPAPNPNPNGQNGAPGPRSPQNGNGQYGPYGQYPNGQYGPNGNVTVQGPNGGANVGWGSSPYGGNNCYYSNGYIDCYITVDYY